MVNKAIVIGRLTADPDVKATPSGVHITKLRVATNTYSGKDEAGNRKEHTEFHQLVCFGRQAEVAGDLLKKGRLIYADGRMQTRSWDTEDGKKHFMTEVVVDSLQIIGPKPGDSPA